MRLQEIGFYTLCDDRAKNVSVASPLWRCELLLTDRCNFHCEYCRGANEYTKGTLSLEYAKHIVDLWASHGLKNIRFSGGEPTLFNGLVELVAYTKDKGVERIAISSNGSADWEIYDNLIKAGVNDFSISLDACCASTGDMMAGGIDGSWNRVVRTIKALCDRKVYTTVGVVLTEKNVGEVGKIIDFAKGLGVSDIRIISAAQINDMKLFDAILKQNEGILPILRYRLENFRNGKNVRGLCNGDSGKCSLVLDDMVIANNFHFPCIIAMREGCAPIGTIDDKNMDEIREERYEWMKSNNTHSIAICKQNCLDVCIQYNNRVKEFSNSL